MLVHWCDLQMHMCGSWIMDACMHVCFECVYVCVFECVYTHVRSNLCMYACWCSSTCLLYECSSGIHLVTTWRRVCVCVFACVCVRVISGLIDSFECFVNSRNIQHIQNYNRIYSILKDFKTNHDSQLRKLNNNSDPSVVSFLANNGTITKRNAAIVPGAGVAIDFSAGMAYTHDTQG